MANARLQITDLDFDQIKNNLKTFLKQQSEFQDYDFEGAGLNVLMDLLAYNTHYNAYYLNMVANEAFLDTAILRDSVVSHAKTLGYTPHSASAAKSIINIQIETANTTVDTATLPRGFSFSSDLIDNISYNFVVLEDITTTKVGTSYFFNEVNIYEGTFAEYAFVNNRTSNPKSVFLLPDSNIDSDTIKVSIQPNVGNTYTEIYNKVTDVLDVGTDDKVFYIQENKDGKYQIYFSNGVIGKQPEDGAIVLVSYLVTNGTVANKAAQFVSNSKVNGFANFIINTIEPAAGGGPRESVDSIKYGATTQFTTQNRLVTVKDYEAYILKNYPNIDAISVWGGEEETPPVYGKVFVSMKPKVNYFISEAEKQRVIDEIIRPKSVVAVDAVIRNPEFLYLKVLNYVEYDKTKTVSSPQAIKNAIRASLLNYAQINLNRYDSTFVLSKAQDGVDSVDLNSIRGSETHLRLEKRFEPEIGLSRNYTVNFNAELHRGTITNKMSSTIFQIFDSSNNIRNAQFEEVPESFTGVSEILITNSGTGYVTAPTVTITGDGEGAAAVARILNGRVESIVVTNRGINYSRAVATITGGDGFGAAAVVVLDTKFGSLRTVYFDSNAERQIINANAGTIDYQTGQILINDIRILSSSSPDGLIRLDIESEKGIVKSNKNTIITIDAEDSTSIVTELVEI